jgi:hypothetical protein
MEIAKYRSPKDRDFISLSEDWEVKWWAASLAVSVQELAETVSKVGNSVAKVRDYLIKQKQ